MIFEAIAAIKIANEAIGALKEMAGNISSIGQAGSHLSKLCDAKEEIQKQADNGDSEAFWELERITQEEKRIKELMVWGGRPNLLQDYETFMRNRKQMRENEKKRAEAKRVAKRKAIKTGLVVTGAVIGVFTAVGLAIFMVYWMVSLRGK